MYVLILDTLTPQHQACQGGHAVAEYLLDNKNTKWANGNMIYLSATADQLDDLFDQDGVVPFFEEDQLTAIACVTDDKKRFQRFKLLGAQ